MIERGLLFSAAVLAASAASGQQTGWDVFTARCLGPMSDVQLPVTDGLSEGGSARATEVMEGRSETQVDYLVRDGMILSVIPEGGRDYLGCFVIDESATARQAFDQYETWLAAQIIAGTWEERDDQTSLLGPYYYSTTWREPKLRLSNLAAVDGDRAILVLTATTTDFES